MTVAPRGLRAVALVAIVLLLGIPPPGSGAIDDPVLRDTFPVVPGLVREVYGISTPAGPSLANVLRFALDDPDLTLTPELARGRVPGREPVHATLQRLGPEAVAAVNGGFWRDLPSGDPDGLLMQGGRYVSEPLHHRIAPRAAFALLADRSYRVGRPRFSGSVWLPSGLRASLGGLNRLPGPEEVVALTADFDRTTGAPPGATEVVLDGFRPTPATLTSVAVSAVRRGGDNAIPRRGTVLMGTGRWASELAAMRPGDLVTIDLRIDDGWRDATSALAAGPMLLRGGEMVPSREWSGEGFDALHNARAHPRTAIGFTSGGEVLLLTVDGRQPDRSEGLTTQETAQLMADLGAVDAMMLDGGGSTTMAVDGRVENRACCDAPGHRAVASALVVRSSAVTSDVQRLAGSDRFATAAAVAQAGWPDGAGTVLLASGRAFPDGLAGGPLGARIGAPLLLTEPGALPRATAAALDDLGAREAIVLGGPAAVADTVVDDLRGRGMQVRRVAGLTRMETAAAIAREVGASGRALLASGAVFADALSSTVPAALAGGPVLLTDPGHLPEATTAVLDELGVQEVVVAGGEAAVAPAVVRQLRGAGYRVTRLAGEDRYATAAALVRWAEQELGFEPAALAVAGGATFPDALAGGPYAARQGIPVLLTPAHALARAPATRRWLQQHAIERGVILGGRVPVGTWVAHELQEAIDSGS